MPMGLRRGQSRRHRLRRWQKLRRQPNRATPRAALGVDYADDKSTIRQGLLVVGVLQNSCSASKSPSVHFSIPFDWIICFLFSLKLTKLTKVKLGSKTM
jgi:hypothetical protein